MRYRLQLTGDRTQNRPGHDSLFVPATVLAMTALTLFSLVAGCGGGSSSNPRASASASPTPSTTPTPTPTPTPVPATYSTTILAASGGKVRPTGIDKNNVISGVWTTSTVTNGKSRPALLQAGVLKFLTYTATDGTAYLLGDTVNINTNGEVLGDLQTAEGLSLYFVLWASGDLVPFSGTYATNISSVNDINDVSTVLSTVTDPTTGLKSGRLLHPIPFPVFPATEPAGSPRYRATDMGTLSGFKTYTVAALNKSEQVIGTAYPITEGEGGRAFVWSAGSVTLLPTLSPGGITEAVCINSAGVVGGVAVDTKGVRQPVLWQSGTVTTLPMITGAEAGEVTAVNANGDAVGIVTGTTIGRVAVLWHGTTVTPLARMVDSSLGLNFTDGIRITDSGQILTFGQNAKLSVSNYYLLTPITL